MRSLFNLLIGLSFFVFLLSSCTDECRDNDCGLPPQMIFAFSPIDSSNNNIYLDTLNPYYKDSLVIYSISNNSLSQASYIIDSCSGASIENKLNLIVQPARNTETLQFQFKADLKINITLKRIYNPGDDCCGRFISEYRLERNGNTLNSNECGALQIILP